MSRKDLSDILQDWPHESGRFLVRLVEAQDGRTVLQIRIDLGILQMEIQGRPDGLQIQGCESWLEVQKQSLAQYQAAQGSSRGFVISEDDCRALREEAAQYFHRYVAMFHVGRFEDVARDTCRNLECIEMCRDYGTTEEDRLALEPFRPQVITMRTRAEAELAIASEQAGIAVKIINQGLEDLEDILSPDHFEDSNEVTLLRGMRDLLVPKLPSSQRAELEDRLQRALDAENYELAAILRDELRQMS
ncbi:MAG: UvrB/UvrC motif-containing protein [Planctomycetota bacterium]|nr:UvrB/UvrC motif-containing protein [Planctomycetota bacterium]